MSNTLNTNALHANNLSSRKLIQLLQCPDSAKLSHHDIQAIELELTKRKQLGCHWQQPH